MGGLTDPLGWELRCLEKARRGDLTSFGELYEAYADKVFAEILLPRLGARAAAEEALAETFRSALEKLGSYEPQGQSIFGWLARIAINKATDLHRARAREGKALAGFEALVAPLRTAGEAAAEVDLRLDRQRLLTAVEAVLATIPPRYREAIELRLVQDLPRPECASRLQITTGNFDVLLLRALRSFRAAWAERHGETKEAP